MISQIKRDLLDGLIMTEIDESIIVAVCLILKTDEQVKELLRFIIKELPRDMLFLRHEKGEDYLLLKAHQITKEDN